MSNTSHENNFEIITVKTPEMQNGENLIQLPVGKEMFGLSWTKFSTSPRPSPTNHYSHYIMLDQ